MMRAPDDGQLAEALAQHVGREGQLAVLLAHDAVDDDGVDVAGARDLHDRIDRVVHRRHVDVVGPQHDDVGLLAGRQRADLAVHPEGAGAVDRRPLQRLARLHRNGLVVRVAARHVVADLLAAREQQRGLHFAEHLAGAIQLDVDAERRRAAGLAIGARPWCRRCGDAARPERSRSALRPSRRSSSACRRRSWCRAPDCGRDRAGRPSPCGHSRPGSCCLRCAACATTTPGRARAPCGCRARPRPRCSSRVRGSPWRA